MSDEVTTRLVTTAHIDAAPVHLRVSSIKWDSDFRATGLRPGDRIVAVDGQPLAPPVDSQQRSLWLSRAVGQYAEGQGWALARKGAGSPVTLTVLRRNTPSGWRTLTFTAALRPATRYTTREGRLALAPGGPDALAADDFSSSWSGWYEREVLPALTHVLDDGWENATFSTRYELSRHRERGPRVDFLAQRYPGSFASAVKADYDAALASLEGAVVPLDDAALHYRVSEDERVERVRAQAQDAWASYRTAISDTTITPFPTVDPIRGDRAGVTGRHVILPPLRNRDWISEAGHTWFVAGNARDGYYFADGEGRAAGLLLRALGRYRRIVGPNIDETYQIVGRVLAAPRQLVINDEAYFGLELEPVAALVGDSLFVDLTRIEDGAARFAGEDALGQITGALPPADASPAAVMQAAIAALKEGDLPLWSALFATWMVYEVGDGQPILQSYAGRGGDDDWERSRRKILGTVYDLRVAWTDDPRVIADGKRYPGAPRIEETVVRIDYVGRVDGVYRTFADGTPGRHWRLQRIDGGPWRIAGAQSI